ncbi:MAG TPA: YdcF family protein [Candidatus Paceibacterota bacterium]|nr:YdcF family protein [Candidatus Paceibacterota bacterium]
MDKDLALNLIWDYMHLHHQLKKADAILVLGNRDIRVGEYAAELQLDGWAPYLVCSGSGDIHNNKPGRELFAGTTEAEVFADIAEKMGVPKASILVENKSQNTGQNYEFAINLLKNRGVDTKTLIAVQKPYMERRTYATGKVWLPDVNLIVTSPPISLNDYPDESNSVDEHWIHGMVGDLQRIKEYPSKGFQIEQNIPDEVWRAYEFLIELGYTNRLIK